MVASSGSLYVFGGNINIQRTTTNALWEFKTILEEEEEEDGEGIIPADGDNQCFNSKSGKSVHTYVALTFWLVFVFFLCFIGFLYTYTRNIGGSGARNGRRRSYLELHTNTSSSAGNNEGEKAYTAL